MKKLLLLVVTLLSASFMSAQTMKEIPVQKRFHTMSENGKYMITCLLYTSDAADE